jgi:hypothetical protein
MHRLLVVLLAGCGATSRPAEPDADADTDADADADGDADADLDCSAHGGLVDAVPAQSCGPPALRSDLELCTDEIQPCERDEQCVVVHFDPCCPFGAVAVLEPAAAGIEARIGVCAVTDPECMECPQPPAEPRCLEGQCALVDCMGPCT